MYLSPNPLLGLIPDNERTIYDVHSIEGMLPHTPYIEPIGTAVPKRPGTWEIVSALHSPDTYGELMFWEWLGKAGVDTDHIAISDQAIAFYHYASYQRESYREHMSKTQHCMSLNGPAWFPKHGFYSSPGRADLRNAWMVPVYPAFIFADGNRGVYGEPKVRLKRIGWALWRITRDFTGRVGFFDDVFACEEEADAIVLSQMCEMLKVYRSQPNPVNTASENAWFEKT